MNTRSFLLGGAFVVCLTASGYSQFSMPSVPNLPIANPFQPKQAYSSVGVVPNYNKPTNTQAQFQASQQRQLQQLKQSGWAYQNPATATPQRMMLSTAKQLPQYQAPQARPLQYGTPLQAPTQPRLRTQPTTGGFR